MPAPGHPAYRARSFRILRLLAALAVISALAAVVAIVTGDSANRGEALVVASVIMGAVALVGMGLSAWPFVKKAKNDPRP